VTQATTATASDLSREQAAALLASRENALRGAIDGLDRFFDLSEVLRLVDDTLNGNARPAVTPAV
jgi:hypothetical protein